MDNNSITVDNKRRKWVAISVTVVLAALLSIWGIYGIGQYGLALFILTPLFIGMAPAILYGHKHGISYARSRELGFLTLGIFTTILILFAIEGLICIAMAAPPAILLTWLGSVIGCATVDKKPAKVHLLLWLTVLAIPSVAFMEDDQSPELTSVVTSIEIRADVATVWKNVIEFPQLDEPDEFIFKAGIAYPTSARIDGEGVGAVRYCNFTTGSFVEPITAWEEARLLKFDVAEQPAPLKELSFWDIDAPHLHDYFVSKRGQFRLIPLPNENTLLEGTTWYYHNIKPAFYWQIWSKSIVHKIHDRVLSHIKKNAELQMRN